MQTNEIGLDGDIILYSVGFATQRNIYVLHEEGAEGAPVLVSTDKRKINEYMETMESPRYEHYVYVQSPMSAYITVDSIIAKWKRELKCDNLNIYLTGKDNFRVNVAKMLPYKGNRNEEKPHLYPKIKDHLIRKHKAIIVEGEEADDALSKMLIRNPMSVCISDDKDLLNTPGYHIRPRQSDDVFLVSQEEADRNFYCQLLTGDTSVDNIPGIRGFGPKTARKYLADCETVKEMECKVGVAYAMAFNDPERTMIEIGQLLWMRRQDNEMWYPQCLGGPKIS